MRWKRWIGIVIAAIAAILLLAYGFQPNPVLVDVAEVQRGPLRVTVEEEGRTRVTDRYVVSAPITGFAPRLPLDVGDPVKAGQILIQLEPTPPPALDPRARAAAEARLNAAQAALRESQERTKSAAADASYWESQLARMRGLLETGDISRDAYDRTATQARQAEARLRSADHAVSAARAEVEAARATLRYSPATIDGAVETVPIRSPVSGNVLGIAQKSAGIVQQGQALLEIADPNALEVTVEVLSADAVRLSPGMRVVFERWGGPVTLEGRVRRIEPVAFTKVSALGVEEQRVLVIVDFTSPREVWASLGDRYRVDASFVVWEEPDVLQVPAGAVFRYGEGWAVFTVENGAARRRAVELGQRTGLSAQVLSGLSEGELVINHPEENIEDGTPIESRTTR